MNEFEELTEEERLRYFPEEPTVIPSEYYEPLTPEELTTMKTGEVPYIIKKGSELLGGAYQTLGRVTGLPVFEDIGTDIKKAPGYVGTMKALYGEYADIPSAFVRGLLWEHAPKIETPQDAGELHKIATTTSHLLGWGTSLLPVSTVAKAVVPAAGILPALGRGAAVGAIYGGAKGLEEGEGRLSSIASNAITLAGFEGASAIALKMSSKIPAVRMVLDKIKAGEKLTKSEMAIQKATEYGTSMALMGGAGVMEPAENFGDRIKNVVNGFIVGGFSHFGGSLLSKSLKSITSGESNIPSGMKLDVEKSLLDTSSPIEQRRIAAEIVINRATEDDNSSLDIPLFRNFVDYAIENKLPINIPKFEEYIRSLKLQTMEEKALQGNEFHDKKAYEEIHKIGETESEIKAREETFLAFAEMKAKNNVPLTPEEISILKKHKPGLLGIGKEIIKQTAITPVSPMNVGIETSKELPIGKIEKSEMSKRIAQSLSEGKEVVDEIPKDEEGGIKESIRDLEERDKLVSDIVNNNPKITLSDANKMIDAATGDIEKSVNLKSKEAKIEKREDIKVDIPDGESIISPKTIEDIIPSDKIKSENAIKIESIAETTGEFPTEYNIGKTSINKFVDKLKNYDSSSVSDVENALVECNTDAELKLVEHYVRHADIRARFELGQASPELGKEYKNKILGIRKNINDLIRERAKVLSENRLQDPGENTPTDMRMESVTNDLIKTYSNMEGIDSNILNENLILFESGKNNLSEIESRLKSTMNKDMVEKYINSIQAIRDNQFRRFSGNLSDNQLEAMGTQFMREGSVTFEKFMDSFRDVVGNDITKYSKQITRLYKKLKDNEISFKWGTNDYQINKENVGSQSHDWTLEINSRDGDSGIRDRTISLLNKNIGRIRDFVSSSPQNKQEEIIDSLSRNIGMGRFIKNKISEWIKIPLWDNDIAPLVKGLNNLGKKSNTIKFGFLKMLRPLGTEPLTQREIDTIIETTLKQNNYSWKNLNKREQERVKMVFDSTRWMRDQFKNEMIENKESFKSIAKKEGYEDVTEWINDKVEKEMPHHYYVPLVRSNGNNIVLVRSMDKKETLWSENFKTKKEAVKRAAELMKQFEGSDVSMFDARDRYGNDFSKIIEMIHDLPYLKNILKKKNVSPERIEELQNLLSGRYLEIWAKGRLAQRKGVGGFSKDLMEVLNSYADYFPRSFVRRFNSGAIADLVKNTPENKQIYAENIVDFYLGRKDYEGKYNFAIRNVIYNWNLGLKPSFALLNLSQRGTTTIWRAIKEMGNDGGKIAIKCHYKELSFYRELISGRVGKKSLDEIIKDSNTLSIEDKQIIGKMHMDGSLESLRNLEIIGKNKASRILNILATTSEKSNRFNATLTAIEIGKKKGLSGDALYEYATDFTNKTQWLYGKENRPVIGRGWRAPLFVFKTYVLNDMNFLRDLYPSKKAFSGAIATRLALGGFGGIFGSELLSEAVDWSMINIVGKDDWKISKIETEKMLKDKYGSALIDIATRGLPSIAGIEGSITFGANNPFDIAGVPLVEGFYKNLKTALSEDGIDWEEWIRRNSPPIVKHMMGFSTETVFGKQRISKEDIKKLPPEIRKRAYAIYKDMPTKMSEKEKILYSLGFSTITPAQFFEQVNAIRVSAMKIKEAKAGMHREAARAIERKNRQDLLNIIEEAKNRKIRLNRNAIKMQLGLLSESEIEKAEMEEMDE